MIETTEKIRATILISFGAAGYLTRRKLMQANYNLYLDGLIHQKYCIKWWNQFSRRGKTEKNKWQAFASFLPYQKAEQQEGFQTKITPLREGLLQTSDCKNSFYTYSIINLRTATNIKVY